MDKAQKLGLFAFTLIFTLAICGAATATAADSTSSTAATQPTYTNNNSSTPHNSSQTTILPDPQIWRGGSYVATYTTIEDAIKAAQSGDTIMLENGATFYEHDLTISKNLDFKVLGGGHATIDAQKKGRIFVINQGVKVNLYNLTLQNGYNTVNRPDPGIFPGGGDGGAIISWGNLTIVNCTFHKNQASGLDAAHSGQRPSIVTVSGGAIGNFGGTLTVIGCTFTDNSVYADAVDTWTARSITNGGAISSLGGTLTVTDSIFTNNWASPGSGAFLLYAESWAHGGAIYNKDGPATVTNSVFRDNKLDSVTEGLICYAEAFGGAIYNENGQLNVTNCEFSRNSASASIKPQATLDFHGRARAYGGAIYNKNGQLTVKYSILSQNKASATSKTVLIPDLYDYGGAIYNDHGSATLNFNSIVGNYLEELIYTELAVFNDGGSVVATLNWWGSNAEPSNFVSGGLFVGSPVFYTPWIVLTVTPSVDFIPTSGTSTITADLTHDSSGIHRDPSYGHVPDGIPVTFSGTLGSVNPASATLSNGMAQTTFTAGSTAGVANVQTTVDNQTVSTKITVGTGGYNIYVSNTGSDTTGDGSPGKPYQTILKGISMLYSGGNLHILGGTYIGPSNRNIAILKNVKIIGEGGTVIIDALNAINNIFTINSGYNVTISNITFQWAQFNTGNGGAISNAGTLTLNNCSFIENIAQDGGAIYNEGTLTVNDCTFTNNSAARWGGAIESKGTLNVNNSTFSGNSAANGGAIDKWNHGALTVNSSNFTNNRANNGGAILNADNALTVNNSTFSGNRATNNGGVIWNGNGVLTVTDSRFEGNTALNGNGGAIYNIVGVADVNGSTFIDNMALNGGAIMHVRNLNGPFLQLHVENSTFIGNIATNHGGAIFNSYGTSNIYYSTFIGNRATNNGGALMNVGDLSDTKSGIANLEFNRIVENSALNGSAIYNLDGTVSAKLNWWGSNSSPQGLLSGVIWTSYTPWIVLTINANPTTIVTGGNSTITADLTHDNGGVYYDPAYGHVPDGIPATFSGGSLDPTSAILINGRATSTFTATTAGVAIINATIDNQTVSKSITVNGSPTSLTVDDVHGLAGQTVDLIAHVIDDHGKLVNEGQVRFTVNSVDAGTALVQNGIASLNWMIPSTWITGHYDILADYLGTSHYNASNGTGILTVQSLIAYVSTHGNDAWDGQSATHEGGTRGPKATIAGAISILAPEGTVHILNGTYNQYNISIDKNMTINGENQAGTIINAQGLGTIFTIINGVNATISNLTLKNGNATVYGGAIYNNGGVLTVTNDTFTANNATGGGAIINFLGNLNVTNCTFQTNSATYGGGAIISVDGGLTITNSIFTGNYVTNGSGGAIISIYGNSNVLNSIFTGNYVTNGSGGAIMNTYGSLNVVNSIFTGNYVTNGSGGAIANLQGTLNVTNITFNGNYVTNGSGGAIANLLGNLNVVNSTLTGNYVTNGDGGAILNWDGNAIVQFNRIVGNIANDGDAIYCFDGSVNAENNWWGSNEPDFDSLIIGDVNVDSWIILTINANPSSILNGGSSIIKADLTQNNLGPSGGFIPDEFITVNFANPNGLGTLNPVSSHTENGIITSIFTATGYGVARITVTIDGFTLEIPVIIQTLTNTTVTNVTKFPGQTVDLVAHVVDYYGADVDEGQVQFTVNGDVIDTVNVIGGVATLNNWQIPSDWTAGIYMILAEYLGTDNYLVSNNTGNLTVTATPTNTTVTNVTKFPGQTVDLVAHVVDYYGADVDEGTVRFKVNNVTAGTTDVVDGLATLNWQIPINWSVGIYEILAEYLGTDNYLASNDTGNLTVIATPTNTKVNPVSGYAGKNVTLKANVTAANALVINEGKVKFTVNNVTAGTVNVVNGLATLNWKIPSNWTGKTYSIVAVYLGTTNYTTSNNTNSLTVKPSAYLALTKTVTSGTHYYGDTINYYLTVKNNGPDSATGVSVYDKLISGLKYLSSSATKGSYKLSTNTWTIGTLLAGQTAKLDIKVLIEKVGAITNTAKLTCTIYPKTSVTKSVSFNVPKAVPIAELIKASKTIKNYYETHNNRLPTSLKVAGQTLTMPQLLNLLVTATINISKKNLKPISVTAVAKAPYPGGNYRNGKVYNYLTVAGNIKTFINNKGRAPNYAATRLGNVPFSKLVYMYAKVVNFYGYKNRLPNWVATYKV